MLEIRSKNCCKSYPETLCMYAEENTDSLLDLWHCRCCNKKKIFFYIPVQSMYGTISFYFHLGRDSNHTHAKV